MCFPNFRHFSSRGKTNKETSSDSSSSSPKSTPPFHTISNDWKAPFTYRKANRTSSCYTENTSMEYKSILLSTSSDADQSENRQTIDPVPFTETLLQRYQIVSTESALDVGQHNDPQIDQQTLSYSMSRYLQVTSTRPQNDPDNINNSILFGHMRMGNQGSSSTSVSVNDPVLWLGEQ